MYSTLDILPDMLTGYEMVCDMSMPLSVFARRDMLDKIAVPPDALKEPRNTMLYERTERIDVPPMVKKKEDTVNEENGQD
jgi:hypothetical protein